MLGQQILAVGLPLEEPVLIFTIAMVAFLVGPLVVKRLGQPGIVGIVVIGAIIGPNAAGLVEHAAAIVLLGEVGLIYLLFTVGIEVDIQRFKDAPENAALFGLTSFFLPFVVGTVASMTLLNLDLWAALLLAAVFSSHTLLAYPVINRLRLTKNRAVTAVFGGILFTDTLALVVLAIVIGVVEGTLSVWLFAQIALALAILFGGTWLVVPRISRQFFRSFSEESYFEFLFVMVALFAAASLAEVLELAPILGAFVAGLALNQIVSQGGTLRNRVEFVGNAFFIPFFLLHVGMLVDPSVILDGRSTLLVTAVILGVMFAGKTLAAWLVAAIQDYDQNERLVILGLSTGQAAAALAIAIIGFEANLFGADVLNAVVLLLLVTAIVSPWLTRRGARRLAMDTEPGEEGPEMTAPTILLPLSRAAELQERLLELTFVLRGESTDEPIHVLTVVQPGRGPIDEGVDETTEKLEPLSEQGDAAEIPVEIETRVNHNVSSGIVQSSIEVRADLIVMGWDATESLQDRIFGSVIDRVLDRTNLPVMISRMGHPVNTTQRLLVVIPSGTEHHDGFYESVHLTKRLAANIGIPIEVMVVEGDTDQVERLFELVEEDVSASYESIDTWRGLLAELQERTEEDDLIVTISPRRGDIGWQRDLDNLPRALAELDPESFISIHPRKGEPEFDRQFLRMR